MHRRRSPCCPAWCLLCAPVRPCARAPVRRFEVRHPRLGGRGVQPRQRALAEAFGKSKAAARQIPKRLDPKILSAEIGKELQKYVSE